MSIRVVVADDQEAVRAGLVLILDDAEDIEVVGQARDGEEAVALGLALRPDVVVMDVRMPRLDGVSATRRLVDEAATDVLVLTTFDLDEYVFGALRAGAAGFLLKDTDAAGLIEAVRLVAGGDGVIAPAVTRRLIAAFGRATWLPTDLACSQGETAGSSLDHERWPVALEGRSALRDGHSAGREGHSAGCGEGSADHGGTVDGVARVTLGDLTPREYDVLGLLGQGLANAEIATRLGVAEATVKTHVSRVLGKLGLRSRVQAAILVQEIGALRGNDART